MSVLEATTAIIKEYIQKYPTSASAYSANIDAAMERLRADVLAFARQVYHELSHLEAESAPAAPPEQ
jgi:hypothetical protein